MFQNINKEMKYHYNIKSRRSGNSVYYIFEVINAIRNQFIVGRLIGIVI